MKRSKELKTKIKEVQKELLNPNCQYKRGGVDLRTCNEGDVLISIHGEVLTYVSPCEEGSYMDHYVDYDDLNLGRGSRTDDGYVFMVSRFETDHDIVAIIKI